jgi:hypothetical protein
MLYLVNGFMKQSGRYPEKITYGRSMEQTLAQHTHTEVGLAKWK